MKITLFSLVEIYLNQLMMDGGDGSLIQETQELKSSVLQVGGKRACSVLPRDVPPPSLTQAPCNSWEARARSDQQCAAIRSSLFLPCHHVVPPQFHHAACRTDMCECPGSQCHCEVLTAYARECERKGVRIPRWREETGCKHVTPFKYSGEVVASAEVSSDIDANLNEVLTEPGEEVEDDFEEEMAVLPVSRLGHAQAAVTVSPSIREKRRREKEKELRRRERGRKKKERRRQKRLKKKRQEKQRSASHSSNSLGNFRGIDVVKVSGGRGLRWGQGRGVGRDARPPPFTMLLSSVDDNSEIQNSGEVRTNTEPAALLPRQMARTGRRKKGRVPEVPGTSGTSGSSGTSYLVPPPPEAESPQAAPQRDWKRRRA